MIITYWVKFGTKILTHLINLSPGLMRPSDMAGSFTNALIECLKRRKFINHNVFKLSILNIDSLDKKNQKMGSLLQNINLFNAGVTKCVKS